MRGATAVAAAAGLLLAVGDAARGSDGFDDAFRQIDRSVGDVQSALERGVDSAMAELDARWEAAVKAEEARWEALRAEVEAKWGAFAGCSQAEWVDYSEDREARSRVDYAEGRVVFEVLVPADEVEPKAPPPRAVEGRQAEPAGPPAEPTSGGRPLAPAEVTAAAETGAPAQPPGAEEPKPVVLPPAVLGRLSRQVERVAAPNPQTESSPIEGQVRAADGAPLTPGNAKAFAEGEVAPRAVVEPGVIHGADGVARRKVRAVVPMVPEHLYLRAGRYKDLVSQESSRYELEPQLVFAIIQTESYFNPLARSPAHTYGLMQLSPRYSALEARDFLERKKDLVTPEYLYVPGNNTRLGTAYLHLLESRYFGDVQDPRNRELLAVAAYRWGAAPVRVQIVNAYPVATMGPEELRKAIDEKAPEETKEYVARVERRKRLYDGLVSPPHEEKNP